MSIKVKTQEEHERARFGCLESAVIKNVEDSPTPASMMVMSMLSDVQELIQCVKDNGEGWNCSAQTAEKTINWNLNSAKLIIEEFLAKKDYEGRHTK